MLVSGVLQNYSDTYLPIYVLYLYAFSDSSPLQVHYKILSIVSGAIQQNLVVSLFYIQ